MDPDHFVPIIHEEEEEAEEEEEEAEDNEIEKDFAVQSKSVASKATFVLSKMLLFQNVWCKSMTILSRKKTG